MELAMTFKAVFPDILAPADPDKGVPGHLEAVSGCNILILPIYASVLRVHEAAHRWPKRIGFATVDVRAAHRSI
jgi:hypothetical protein